MIRWSYTNPLPTKIHLLHSQRAHQKPTNIKVTAPVAALGPRTLEKALHLAELQVVAT